MIRAFVMVSAVLVLSAAFAEPAKDSSGEASITVLRIEYRNARIRGERENAVKILRKILFIVPKDCDWRLVLAEELLQLRRTRESREEFFKILEIEPEFQEAAVGIARTFASEGNDTGAKIHMLKAARNGYRAALMMRKAKLAGYFNEYSFVIELVDADRPEVGKIEDPFHNPLRKKGIDVIDEKKPTDEISRQMQKRLVRDSELNLTAAVEFIKAGKPDESLAYYRKIEVTWSMREKFTDRELRKELERTFCMAQETLYPKIESLIREQTLGKAESLLEKLVMSVGRRDRAEADRLNSELVSLAGETAKGRDGKLKAAMMEIDVKRAKEFRTIDVLSRFEREVRPILHLCGTITGRDNTTGDRAFFEVGGREGLRRLILGESDEVGLIKNLRVLRIGEDAVDVRFEDVIITLRLGRKAAP